MKTHFLFLLFAALLLSSCEDEDKLQPFVRENPFIVAEGGRPLVVAHRGGAALAPENTILAFDNAQTLGADVFEMDVVLTADEQLVVIHDETIDRTSEGTGNVADYTLAELKAMNFAYDFEVGGEFPYRSDPVRIPTINEILERYPDQLMFIEIKSSGENGLRAAELLVDLIRDYNMEDKVMLFSFTEEVTNKLHNLGPGMLIGASIGDAINFIADVQESPDAYLPIRADVFALPTGISLVYSPAVFRSAALNNAGMYFWTIDDKDEMISLVQRGADGIITDKPDLLIETLEELGF